MSLIVVEAIRGQCASFMVLKATVSEIFGGQTNFSILVVEMTSKIRKKQNFKINRKGERF